VKNRQSLLSPTLSRRLAYKLTLTPFIWWYMPTIMYLATGGCSAR